MSDPNGMRPDRKLAIEVMQAMGWEAKRTKPGKHVIWEFRRDDAGGWYGAIPRRQDQLSLSFAADIAMQYGDAPELAREIAEAKERWIKARFFGLLSRQEAVE